MKDFTVYSKYETFVHQLQNSKVEAIVRPISAANIRMQNVQFIDTLCQACYKPNDAEMIIKYDDSVSALLYTPCVDRYQKQYVVCVLFVDLSTQTVIGKQCYKEAVNPLCISNANIKDILNELAMYEQTMEVTND